MKRFWKDLKSHYRYAIYSAKSELKSEVANSYLNWIWWVLEPFCFMLIYAFIFGVVFNASEHYSQLFCPSLRSSHPTPPGPRTCLSV